jgi:hypothetical protein
LPHLTKKAPINWSGARRLDNERIAACPVIAIADEQPDAVHIALNDQAEAILLDLVNPAA